MEPNCIEPIPTATGSQKRVGTKSATITINEIARVLRIGRLRVYCLLDSHAIPGVRLGPRGRWLISRSAFERWLATAGSNVA